MPVSPTQRSLKWLDDRGWLTAIVEKWNAFAKVKQDLFGFIDLLAVKTPDGILGVQTTSGSNVAARIEKILASRNLVPWLGAGGRVEVHGWRKIGPRGGRKVWKLRRVVIKFNYNYQVITEEVEDE